tara:strand:- start:4923 stop:5066 length:144 start_codon:yes stop_codon:yes gene_type:complete
MTYDKPLVEHDLVLYRYFADFLSLTSNPIKTKKHDQYTYLKQLDPLF